MNYEIITKPDCRWCELAKRLLDERDIAYVEWKLGVCYTKEELLERVPGARTVPQIFGDDGQYIGGYKELKEHLDD